MLVIPVEPIVGESLSGLIARAAAANSYTSSSDVLDQANISSRCAECASARSPGDETRLANTLGTHAIDLIKAMFKTPVVGRPGWSNFFGTPLRDIYREQDRRRVSPRALKRSPHARAIWSVRIFSFDPETKEKLIDRCPVCQRSLGWKRSLGIAFCDHCTQMDSWGFQRPAVDLRDFPQSVVEIEDEAPLDFVTGLIDPDPAVRSSFRPTLPTMFDGVARCDLFEFVATLAFIILAPHTTRFLNRRRTDEISPEILARAGRMVLNWPKGFEQLASEVQAAASNRPGHYGVRKEFGVLHRLNGYSHLAQPFRVAIKKEINTAIERTAARSVLRQLMRNRQNLITAQKAEKKYGIPRKKLRRLLRDPRVCVYRAREAMKSPTLFLEPEIAALAKERNDLPKSGRIAAWLGVPVGALFELEQAGLISRENGPVIQLVGPDRCYHKKSVDTLIDLIRGQALALPSGKNCVPLRKAMHQMLPGEKPWVQTFQSILSSELHVYQNHNKRGGLSDQLSIESSDELAKIIAHTKMPRSSLKNAEWITIDEAASIIGTAYCTILDLIKTGLIPESPDKREKKIQRADVGRFIASYMLTPEIARQLGTNIQATNQILKSGGVRPVRRIGKRPRLVWSRSKVGCFTASYMLTSEIARQLETNIQSTIRIKSAEVRPVHSTGKRPTLVWSRSEVERFFSNCC